MNTEYFEVKYNAKSYKCELNFIVNSSVNIVVSVEDIGEKSDNIDYNKSDIALMRSIAKLVAKDIIIGSVNP